MSEMADSLDEVSNIDRDFMKVNVLLSCAFYKPLKLKPYNQNCYYVNPKMNDLIFVNSRVNMSFPLYELNFIFCERFIELLAPLTLHYFSISSKDIYRHCLNIRGLEYSDLLWHLFIDRNEISFYTGMKTGFVVKSKLDFVKYIVCHGQFEVQFKQAPNDDFNFVKNYKLLRFCFDHRPNRIRFTDNIGPLFHPKLEHVYFSVDYNRGFLINSELFLGYCKNVKTLNINVWWDEIAVKKFAVCLESFGAVAPNLELLFLAYSRTLYQLHDGKLQQCVKQENKWVLSNQIQLTPSPHPHLEEDNIPQNYYKIYTAPGYFTRGCYSDIDVNVDSILATPDLFGKKISIN